MNKNNNSSFFDKFKKIIGIDLGNSKKENAQCSVNSNASKAQSQPKTQEALKKEINNVDATAVNQKAKDALQKSEKIKKQIEDDEEDEADGIRVGFSAKKQQLSYDSDKLENESSNSSSKLLEKFQKKGLAPKKDLKQIAREAEEKKKEQEGQAFTDGDAAKKDLKKKESGYEKIIKKKTKKALEGKVFLVRGKDNGKTAWHYVLVSKEAEAELKKQKAGTNIDVADYGKIIKSGWGDDPSEEDRKMIEEEYGS